MERIKQLYEGTKAKFTTNKANIEGLLSLEKTKPAKKAILRECQENEIAEYEVKISQFEGVWTKMQQTYSALSNEIGDFGELLNECELKTCCDLIARLGTMQTKLTNIRHQVTDMDSNIDLMRVKIGELDINQASQEYQE